MRASYRVFALLREHKIAAPFKDLGAGGIVGCSAEMTAHGGYGARIELSRVNVAVEGLPPEVIAVGETQERMMWVAPPGFVPDLLRIYNEEFGLPDVAYNARAVVIGEVTAEQRYVLQYRELVVMDVESEFLTGAIHDELPYTERIYHGAPAQELPAVDIEEIFPRVLAHRDICSREPLYRRYDSVVRGRTVLPRGAADAGVLAAVPGSPLGVALAVAGNPRYGRIDPAYAAEQAVLEATRRVVAVGAHPIGLTDCLNFGNPRKAEQYGEFVAAVEALTRAATELDLPFVSGNVSLYNETASGRAIPPSAIVACIGSIDNVANVITSGFKAAGSTLLWVGSRELVEGGSVLAELLGLKGTLPDIDYNTERAALAIVRDAIARGVMRSCRVVARGGMLTAVARLAFDALLAGRKIGAEIDFGNPLCEAGGFVCEIVDDSGVDVTGTLQIGTTVDAPELIVNGTRFDVERLYETWSQPLGQLYP
jgi:phosphoribosylformylglycinamidine synthase